MPSNQNIQRTLEPFLPWNFIGNTNAIAQGHLIGGCVETLIQLYDSSIWPSFETWTDSILFLETCEYGMNDKEFEKFLEKLAFDGILKIIKGIIFGIPGGDKIDVAKFSQYDQVFLEVFSKFSIPLVPIITQMNFGHSDPMLVLPYGAIAEIDPIEKVFKIFN